MEQALYWLGGAVGVPLIGWLKDLWQLEGKQAMLLTAAVSVVLGVAALFVSHQLTGADLSWENVAAVFGQVLAAATLAYKLLQGEK